MKKISLGLLLVIALVSCKKPQKKIIGEWFLDNEGSSILVNIVIEETSIKFKYNDYYYDGEIQEVEYKIENLNNNSFDIIRPIGVQTTEYFFRDSDLYLSNGDMFSRYERVK
jgi:hypothetical protein